MSAGQRLAALAPNGVPPLLAEVRCAPAAFTEYGSYSLSPRKHAERHAIACLQCMRELLHTLTLGMPPYSQGFDHQNLELSPDYIPRMRDFLSHVRMHAHRDHASRGLRPHR